VEQRVVNYQMPDGTWVQQVVNVDVNVPGPIMAPQFPPQMVTQPQPLPPPPQGVGAIKGAFNGDLRWNPVTRQYEYVTLDRPPRTGWRKAFWGQ
jgi:hypothetical protein